MIPISASDILRKNSPREMLGQTFAHVNRFDNLRDVSPAPSFRSRADSSVSTKRKGRDAEGDDLDRDDGRTKVSRMDEGEEVELVFIESKISKVSTMCGKLTTEVQQQQLEVDDAQRAFLSEIVTALRVINEVQNDLLNLVKTKTQVTDTFVSQHSYSSVAAGRKGNTNGKSWPVPTASRKNLAGGLVAVTADERGKLPESRRQDIPEETEEEKLQRKFTDAIRDAERSTLCFNLNMGNVPIMNKSTISEKASLALTKMAAEKEGRNSFPSADAVAAIDDVTSLVTKMEFFGASTKQYKGKGSTGFCTVPVKYQFKDKDHRIYAEKTLRETCQVKCATPYPAIVRECIKQVVDHVRLTHPEDFVRVSVVPK
jgi:hypothetical protein